MNNNLSRKIAFDDKATRPTDEDLEGNEAILAYFHQESDKNVTRIDANLRLVRWFSKNIREMRVR